MIRLKNTKKVARVAALLTVLCMISMVMIGGTFAKYTSTYSGADTALIAKWKVTPKEGSTAFAISPAAAVPLDLFSHAYNTNIKSTAGSEKIIAPGVQGQFVLNVANEGDVAAQMTFDFAVTGTATTVPIEYSIDNGTTWGNLTTLKTNLEALASMTTVADTNGTATATVKWRWPFDASGAVYGTSTNITDTALGVASASGGTRSTYILTITATATQKSPGGTTALVSIGAITGTAKVGNILSAGALTPAGADATYQWRISADNVTYSDIAGATDLNYTMVPGDANKYIKVKVTGTGNYTGTSESVATAQIAP